MLKIKTEKLNNLMNRVSGIIPDPKTNKQKVAFTIIYLFLSPLLLSGMIFVLADLAGYGESGPTAAPNSLDYGLVGHWDFEEGGGQTVYDRSGNGNNGILGASAAVGTDDPTFGSGHDSSGEVGTGIATDGVNDYVDVGNGSSLNVIQVSFCSWFYSSGTTGTYQSIISKNNYYWLLLDPTRTTYYIQVKTPAGYITATPSFSKTSQWVNACVTFGGVSDPYLRLYENGVQIYTSAIRNENMQSTTASVAIGKSTYSNPYYFSGKIDEVRIYNRAITADEVQMLYNQKKPALEINFDEGSGVLAKDNSFNNYDGTVYGATGTAESGDATTLTDNNKSWTTNEWANETIYIVGGTGLGQNRAVTSNTTTAVTVSSAWTTNPDATSVYAITSQDEWTSGKQGGAIDFDGTDDYVDLGDVFRPSRTNGRSFSFWVYSDSLGNRAVFSTGNLYNLKAGYSEFTLNSTNITVSYDFDISPYRYSFPVTADIGQWNHFILAIDVSDSVNTVLNLYKNGKLASSMTQQRVLSGANNESFLLGARYSGATDGKIYPFDGKIDKFKIYNYTLSDDEASVDYNDSLSAHLGKGNQDLDYGLAGHWNFEEGSGQTVYDKSGNGHDGTLGANSSVGTDDPVFVSGHDSTGDNGTGLKFDGINDSVEVGSVGSFSAVSVSAWVYYNGLNAGWKGIFDQSRGISSNGGFTLSVGDASEFNKVVMMLSDGTAPSPRFKTTEDLPLNQWVHIVSVWDGTTSTDSIKIYFNGIKKIGTEADYGTLPATATLPARIGSSNATFPGSIDEVRLYDRVISEEEILMLYNQKKPILEMKFDEGSGSVAYDESFNNNDGVITGATWTEGKFANALSFDGTDDYVGVPDNSVLDITDKITMGAWIKKSALGDGIIAGKSGAYLLGFSSTDKVYYNHYNGSSWDAVTYSNHSIIDTNWHYVLVTYSKSLGKVQIYIDGVLDGESSNGSTIATNVSQFTVGYLAGWSNNWYFSGSIDDVRIYNYIRTQEEILTDYNEGKSVKLGENRQDLNSGLVGYWNFEEGGGQTIYDSSGNGNNGTLGVSVAVGADDPTFGSGHDSSGEVGTGIATDGVNDYVNFGNSANIGFGTSDFSIGFWINVGTVTTYDNIIAKGLGTWGVADVKSINININSTGYLEFTIDDSFTDVRISSSTPVLDSKWHYAMFSFDRDGFGKIYIDGVLRNQASISSVGDITSTDNLYVGGRAGSYNFTGLIDEVRIYNRAISDDEVRMLYNQKKPILEMKFDEGSGSVAYDESFNNNDGIITGATWTEGKFGNALVFDGSDYVDLGNSSVFNVTNQATFSAWVKASNISSNCDIIGKQDSYLLRFSASGAGKVQLILKSAVGWNFSSLSSSRVDDGAWHHIAGVYDGSKMRMYIDGGIGATDVNFSSNIVVTTNNVFVGARAVGSEYFSGSIDEARVYNYARSADEIKTDYNNGLAAHLR